MISTQPIIVFDSGIGGLSIYRPLQVNLPRANILYIADSVNFPYGDKSSDWLLNRFQELSVKFSLLNPSLVVLACNSATTNIIGQLRSTLSCPVVGVEPVIKPLSAYRSSLAIMTRSSAESLTTAKLLKLYGSHVRIHVPRDLAKAIEFNDYKQVKKNIHEIKKIVQKYHVEAIGLSCTHYPLILTDLHKAMPDVVFIDPSDAVVKEVMRVLALSK
ncbi:hypothetical protein COT87_02990 [Candidatus Collierbacteria bacterium CG10_big_fil_rev_8_21_14_0_10_44_9]|uniref:Uncharacterized protein n=1 Tax=Candidatus Collierbacteria bacterium CG10_big_fil_rev_8_21_14_0_10_44_9 TaxID=1974535 RepID=A0A2H0VI72_9BACT|nr:MAG: hypothetical protein COT87_02990 [Candidatus Collierbacteria bacterium CG10_big_fil_rev_8_21_14_0_10_44_9]